MNACPQCNYLLDAFDRICPRCQGKGVKATAPAASATSTKMQRLKKEALQTESTSSTVSGSARGALLFLLPAVITCLAFSALMAGNDPSLPPPFTRPSNNPFYHPVREFSIVYFLLFLSPCLLCGAGIGGWIGSSFPVQDIKKGALGGVAVAFVLSLLMSAISYFQLRPIGVFLFLVLFFGVILCGAYGGAERQRNDHGENDGSLFALLGIGLFSACLPIVGLLLTVVLTRNGSDKANASLGGTILGFVFQAVLFIAAMAAPH